MTLHPITRGAGSVGSHLAERLAERGKHVVIIEYLSAGGLGNVDQGVERRTLESLIDDVRESLAEDPIGACDVTYRSAASAGLQLASEGPQESIVDNVVNTEVVLRNASRYRRDVMAQSGGRWAAPAQLAP
jgi:UDP-glucose 4-epimerase